MIKKSLYLATLLVLASVKVMVPAEPNSLSVEVDADRLKYRACLHLSDQATEYDSLDLVPVARGLAPRGARVFVKGDSGQAVACANAGRGYSSSELDSGSPIYRSSFEKAPQSGNVCSEWLDIRDLVRGFDQCSRVPPDEWAKLSITFTVTTRDKTSGTVQGQSVWIDLSSAARRQLAGR